MRTTFLLRSGTSRTQSGVALFIALISLVALSFAGLALMRSVDTTNVISGNLAFRQSTLHATDIGVEAALTSLNTIVTTSIDANWPSSQSAGGYNYYPIRQTSLDAAGVPTGINWSLVTKDYSVDSAYGVQYVIDRLCDGPAPVTDIATKCMRTTATTVGSNVIGKESFSGAGQVYYRATIRVLGPRNTVSMTQVLFAR